MLGRVTDKPDVNLWAYDDRYTNRKPLVAAQGRKADAWARITENAVSGQVEKIALWTDPIDLCVTMRKSWEGRLRRQWRTERTARGDRPSGVLPEAITNRAHCQRRSRNGGVGAFVSKSIYEKFCSRPDRVALAEKQRFWDSVPGSSLV